MTRLHVGIYATNYTRMPHALNGCLSDAASWEQFFRDGKAHAIDALLEEDATANNIKNSIVSTLNAARDGDVCAFCASMHGTWIEDAREPDGRNEGLFAHDEDVVWDDWIRSVFASYPHVRIVMLADTCYSGGLDRANTETTRPRFVRAPMELLRVSRQAMRRVKPVESIGDNIVLHSAAAEHEAALDVHIPTGKLKGYHGAFTWAALSTLMAYGPESHGQWHRLICDAIRDGEYDQHPQLIATKRGRKSGVFL